MELKLLVTSAMNACLEQIRFKAVNRVIILALLLASISSIAAAQVSRLCANLPLLPQEGKLGTEYIWARLASPPITLDSQDLKAQTHSLVVAERGILTSYDIDTSDNRLHFPVIRYSLSRSDGSILCEEIMKVRILNSKLLLAADLDSIRSCLVGRTVYCKDPTYSHVSLTKGEPWPLDSTTWVSPTTPLHVTGVDAAIGHGLMRGQSGPVRVSFDFEQGRTGHLDFQVRPLIRIPGLFNPLKQRPLRDSIDDETLCSLLSDSIPIWHRIALPLDTIATGLPYPWRLVNTGWHPHHPGDTMFISHSSVFGGVRFDSALYRLSDDSLVDAGLFFSAKPGDSVRLDSMMESLEHRFGAPSMDRGSSEYESTDRDSSSAVSIPVFPYSDEDVQPWGRSKSKIRYSAWVIPVKNKEPLTMTVLRIKWISGEEHVMLSTF